MSSRPTNVLSPNAPPTFSATTCGVWSGGFTTSGRLERSMLVARDGSLAIGLSMAGAMDRPVSGRFGMPAMN